MISEHLFQRTDLRAASDISWGAAMDSQFNLVVKIPSKISVVLTGDI